MRHVTEEGINLIKRFEGFSSSVYICPAGYPTIGYGHVIRDDENHLFAEGINKEEGEELLRQDVHWAERGVLKLIDVPLTEGQFDSLVSFTFNLGSGALQRSTLRRKVNREEHGDVPVQLKRWVWAGGRKLKGLNRGVAIFAKACFGHPSPSKQQKLNATTYASGGPDSSSSPRPDPTRGRNIGSK